MGWAGEAVDLELVTSALRHPVIPICQAAQWGENHATASDPIYIVFGWL